MAVQLLINGLEFWLKMVWKTWKSQGISSSDFAGHPIAASIPGSVSVMYMWLLGSLWGSFFIYDQGRNHTSKFGSSLGAYDFE